MPINYQLHRSVSELFSKCKSKPDKPNTFQLQKRCLISTSQNRHITNHRLQILNTPLHVSQIPRNLNRPNIYQVQRSAT
jgi:hypothetical protein